MEPLDGIALVLGASSGFGAATARALAREGMDVCGVHLDRRSTLAQAGLVADAIRAHGRRAWFFNVNAADEAKRAFVLDALQRELGEKRRGAVKVLFHSLAFGTLKALAGDDPVSKAQLEMTLDVMAHTLVYWTQDLLRRELIANGARIFAMTSSGGTRTIPLYGPVAAAKAALESHCRQLAFELAPRGIAVNALRAGVTDTPALAKIPSGPAMLALQRERHPAGRTTTVDDVAELVVLLARPGARWLTGNTLGVDGGEDLLP